MWYFVCVYVRACVRACVRVRLSCSQFVHHSCCRACLLQSSHRQLFLEAQLVVLSCVFAVADQVNKSQTKRAVHAKSNCGKGHWTMYLRFLGFFFFCVPQLYIWGSPLLGEIFAYVTVFNPTIKVVTFRLRGWCVLGVFCCRHSLV